MLFRSSTFISIFLSGALSAPTTAPGGSNLVGDPIELAAMKGAVYFLLFSLRDDISCFFVDIF